MMKSFTITTTHSCCLKVRLLNLRGTIPSRKRGDSVFFISLCWFDSCRKYNHLYLNFVLFFPKNHNFIILKDLIKQKSWKFKIKALTLQPYISRSINEKITGMKKKTIIPIVIIGILLVGGIVYLGISLHEQKKANLDMQELAELDKKEMESEYKQFADQYGEMKSQITNDSIIAQLTAEQMRTQQLLEELKQVKSSDAREIARLKKELATVRAVLRNYVMQIDSLNRLNANLTEENTRVKGQYEEATRQIEGLNSERASLSQKVELASQLDATSISMQMLKKNGKSEAKKVKDCKRIQVNFNIAKNVTASNGVRTLYVCIYNPNNQVLTNGGTFSYENRTLSYSMSKNIEYTGKETPVTLYWEVGETLSSGTYRVSVFADGQMIGSRTFAFNK